MTLKDKIIPVALVAALLGGSVGAIVSRKSAEPETATTTYTKPSADLFDKENAREVSDNSQVADQAQTIAANAESISDPASYRVGFLDGFMAGRDRNVVASNTVTERIVPATRTVYRNTPVRSRSYSRASNSRQVYYDYNQPQPRKRSFWQKHRDKLTVAMGAGGGALIGSLLGGKKGAAIGALAGGGGAAVYTYGIRKRNRTY
ncbi:MAG TPA: hypothetical protein VJT09_15265 [Pyrinomonadaceae bacterium]|nr:hypothetical protein [Pyrinomonadaceae bacterium]